MVLGMVVNRGKWEGGGSWRAGGGWDSRSSQWKSGGLDGDWEGWEGWEDWDKWEESPNAPVDQKWKDVWKEGYEARYSAAAKKYAPTVASVIIEIFVHSELAGAVLRVVTINWRGARAL